jgi:hypothetical protein
MVADPDEEALSWSGETDPTHVAARETTKARASASAKPPSDVREQRTPLNPAALIVFGILAGIYLLYAIGWVIFGYSSGVPVQGAFFSIMYQVGEALAIASPFLWAIAVWLRVKNPAMRMLWLFVGVVVLAPWPFIVSGLG